MKLKIHVTVKLKIRNKPLGIKSEHNKTNRCINVTGSIDTLPAICH